MVRGDDKPPHASPSTRRQQITRRLAAIIGLDVAGYSALMGRQEEDTHRRVNAEIDRMSAEITKSSGRIFTFAGDGIMAEFPSAVEALRCALRIQSAAGRRNARLPAGQRIVFRIGINAGEIMLQDDRTGGTAVNVAARLEALAEPGGVCLSAAVFEQVQRIVATSYEPVGERRLKNIRDPVAVYAIPAAACSAYANVAPQRVDPPVAALALRGGDNRPSLAVLPFRTLQPDQADAYFAEGMIDDIIRALGGLKDLLVISRSSTIGFARQPLDVRRVGRELDVRYVLHGSVRRSADALRIAVELSEAATGAVIWADRFDGALAELFDLQDRIALRVATTIAPQLRERELIRATRKHPDSMTAYDVTLQALDRFHRMDRGSIEQARDLLERAIVLDPDYSAAHSHLAFLQIVWIGQGWSTDDRSDSAKSRDHARKAIERDRNDALGLACYGHTQSFMLRDYDVAQEYLARATAAGPSCAWAWVFSSLTAGYIGDYATAICRAERAVRLSPVGSDAFWMEHSLSQACYLGGRYDDAVGWAQMSAAHAPSNASNLRCLIASLVASGEVAAARLVADQMLQIAPGFRLSQYRAASPLPGEVLELFVDRLRQAGLPD